MAEASKITLDARDEIMRSIDDLRQTIPGLDVSCLITRRVSNTDCEALFITTAEIEHAAECMAKILVEGVKDGTLMTTPSKPGTETEH